MKRTNKEQSLVAFSLFRTSDTIHAVRVSYLGNVEESLIQWTSWSPHVCNSIAPTNNNTFWTSTCYQKYNFILLVTFYEIFMNSAFMKLNFKCPNSTYKKVFSKQTLRRLVKNRKCHLYVKRSQEAVRSPVYLSF